jgi:hypothetical protein
MRMVINVLIVDRKLNIFHDIFFVVFNKWLELFSGLMMAWGCEISDDHWGVMQIMKG